MGINQELKDITKKYNECFRIVSEKSRSAYVNTLPPGATIPKGGKIFDQESRAFFEDRCQEFRSAADNLIGSRLSDLKKMATDAPSTEAVNTISLLNMRKNISESEISDLLARYGDNIQAYNTIVSIAKEHNIHTFSEHGVSVAITKLEDLQRSVDNALTVHNAEEGRATDGFMSMLQMQIDDVIPDNEED